MLSLHVDWNQTWLWGFASVISWSGECCFHIGICNHEKSHTVSTTWTWSVSPYGKSVIGCQCSCCDVTKALMLPHVFLCKSIATKLPPPVPRPWSVGRYAIIPLAYAHWPPRLEPLVHKIAMNNFATLMSCAAEVLTPLFLNEFNITSLISIKRKFLTNACKVWTFHSHQSNSSLLKHTGHCEHTQNTCV
jgi:hypothetical protein